MAHPVGLRLSSQSRRLSIHPAAGIERRDSGMSDKTKHFADMALIARQSARMAARAAERERLNPPPQCQCGLTDQEVTIWAYTPDSRKPPKFYCRLCMPAVVREELGLSSNLPQR
jgi:hypothetical protein